MSSSIFFKFKSEKNPSQISFDGPSLSVFEVKHNIMSIARLGDGKDIDLEIYTSDTNEEYSDDTTQIPRSTTVIARRKQAQRPGAGRASRYVTGQAPLHAKVQRAAAAKASAPMSMGDGKAMTEEEKLQAVLNASNNQLKADLQNAPGREHLRNNHHKKAAVPDKPLPPGYMCHRCGKQGHWIQACPTNDDPNFDGKHKFKRTTGIPKSFHVEVEVDHAIGEDGKVDPTKLGKGVMYTQEGKWVRAKADEATWQKYQEQQKANAEKAKEAAQGDQELRERDLECSIDMRPFADPVKTPCCSKTYCRDCIENVLLDADLVCPNCEEQVLIDDLQPDQETADKLVAFEKERKAEKVQKEKEACRSPAAAAATPQPEAAHSPTAAPATEVKADSPSSSSSNSKKRPAEEELKNERRPSNPAEMKKPIADIKIPTGPKALREQQAAQQVPQDPQAMMQQIFNQMSSMPPMQNGMNAFANPMMGMMGMGMPMMNGMMPPMGMIPGMGMGVGMGMNGMGMNGMNGGMGFPQGPQQQQQQQQQQPWMNRGNGTPNNGAGNGGDGAYFRQPVNPHRHQGKQRRQRSVDYKQM